MYSKNFESTKELINYMEEELGFHFYSRNHKETNTILHVAKVPERMIAPSIRLGPYNGYVEMESTTLTETAYPSGILMYLPVHGGITFTNHCKDGSVMFGFDCAHAVDMKPDAISHNIEWVAKETERLAYNLRIAEKDEEAFLQLNNFDSNWYKK